MGQQGRRVVFGSSMTRSTRVSSGAGDGKEKTGSVLASESLQYKEGREGRKCSRLNRWW